MANQLTMALIDTIQRLRQQNWSQRRIALELEIDRETVSRYLRLAEAPKPASAEGRSMIQNQPLRRGRSTILRRLTRQRI